MRTVWINVGLLLIFLILLGSLMEVGPYWTNRSQAYDYRDYVQAQVERNGGLTNDVMKIVNKYNQKHYGGRYTVESLSGNDAKPYGTEVNYKIIVPLKINMFNITLKNVEVNGTATTLVR